LQKTYGVVPGKHWGTLTDAAIKAYWNANCEEDLHLVECHIQKEIHLYKCESGGVRCPELASGSTCDLNGKDCAGASYRGDNSKSLRCTGFFKEILNAAKVGGKRGKDVGCDNIPLRVRKYLGCGNKTDAAAFDCAKAKICARVASIE
jgi:hypothetical protein